MEAPSDPVSEEEVVEVRRFQDPCLPSPLREPFPQDLGCSEQRFEQDQSNQSKPSVPGGLWAVYAQGLVYAHEDFCLAIGKG